MVGAGAVGLGRGSSGLGVPRAHQFSHRRAFDDCSVAAGGCADDANEAPVFFPSSSLWLVENETLHCFKIL